MVAVCQRAATLTEGINTFSFFQLPSKVASKVLLIQVNCTGLLDTHGEDLKNLNVGQIVSCDLLNA